MEDPKVATSLTSRSLGALPTELLQLILRWTVALSRDSKNSVLEQRRVCKTFDQILSPIVFKTIKADFSHFAQCRRQLRLNDLEGHAVFCESMHVNMVLVRDEMEVLNLKAVDDSLESELSCENLRSLIKTLEGYCMRSIDLDSNEFAARLENTWELTPNLNCLRLTLPLQLLANRPESSTHIFAATLQALAKRSEEHQQLEALVVDYLTDVTIAEIGYNHRDLLNAQVTFRNLKRLVLSLRHVGDVLDHQAASRGLWYLIRLAIDLESLCLVGWMDPSSSRVSGPMDLDSEYWSKRCLPYFPPPELSLTSLRCLELKNTPIWPQILVSICTDTSHSLKELYLNDVRLKIRGAQHGVFDTSRWIGFESYPKTPNNCRVAESLRQLEMLHLDVLRATNLGYDDFEQSSARLPRTYDIEDPKCLGRSLDQRFVEEVLGINQMPQVRVGRGVASDLPQMEGSLTGEYAQTTSSIGVGRSERDFDAATYLSEVRNPTSKYLLSIDGFFVNSIEKDLLELGEMTNEISQTMGALSESIRQANSAVLDPFTGIIV